MHQLTVSIQLDEEVYQTLTHYAAITHRDIESIISEILTGQLGALSRRVEQERIKALPLEERRALARGAWGSWALRDGENSVDLIRQLRAEWTR